MVPLNVLLKKSPKNFAYKHFLYLTISNKKQQ